MIRRFRAEMELRTGLMLVALLRLREHTGASKYFDFVRKNVDLYVAKTEPSDTYDRTDYNLTT